MTPLLDDRARDLLERERRLLARLGDLLDRAGLADDARRAREAAEGLSDAFLVVVVGEFNAGKSSVLNALFGAKLMEEGPIPTTAKITLLRYGDEPLERQLTAYLVERRVPSDLLRFLTLVDTHLAGFIAAAFLFQFGTGPIRGFAVTLSIGLLANLFTSTFVSKTMFEVGLARRHQVTSLSI